MLGNETSDELVDVDIPEDAKNAREMLDYLGERVQHAKEAGCELSEVEDMLTAARIMIESGEISDAVEIISQCMQMASQRFSDHEILTVTIRKAEREIQAAHKAGKDVSEAGKQLKMARLHMENGDYKVGIESAKHAIEALGQKKTGEIAWGSGLATASDSE